MLYYHKEVQFTALAFVNGVVIGTQLCTLIYYTIEKVWGKIFKMFLQVAGDGMV